MKFSDIFAPATVRGKLIMNIFKFEFYAVTTQFLMFNKDNKVDQEIDVYEF